MTAYTVHAAKTQLSRLIAEAESGEEVIIMRGDVPAVRLMPVSVPAPKRVFGALKGKVVVPPSFFEPLPAEELDGWER